MILSLLLTLAFQTPATDVLHPHLRKQMRTATPGQWIDAYLVMADPVSLESLEKLTGGLDHKERCRLVASQLKEHALKHQVAARAVLDAAETRGEAGRVRILWMGNAIVFAATPGVLEELAALPGIDRIRSVLDPPLEQLQDGAPLPMPTGSTYPFCDDFETGSIGAHWTVAATGTGAAQTTNLFRPNGDDHLQLSSTVGASASTASITVSLDLLGQANVGLRFKHKNYDDVEDAGDGVFISDDGVTFHLLDSLVGPEIGYITNYIDLDQAIVDHGLSFTSTFAVRFSWEGDSDVPTTGFHFDDILIAPSVGSPPVLEPHIGALQATQLWDIGFAGEGVLIANLDTGVEWQHPDLFHRVRFNPNEIPNNLIDDDANGHVDDIVGWDFADDDNNPDATTSSHGTSSAGLQVGDGTSGSLTGIAKNGSFLALRISTEASFWLAQQYCVDMGVDVISSSVSYKWASSPKPDYHMHRQLCDMELAAGIIHACSTGNEGNLQGSFPIPFNISTPGNCPQPYRHPDADAGGKSATMACVGIHLADDSLYTPSGRGPTAWEDITVYDAGYPHTQDPTYWDYPRGGFGGTQDALLKPDIATFTNTVQSTVNGGGYGVFTGTSAAAAQLGGCMMLLRQVQPNALPRHICAALELSAEDLGDPGKDTLYGSGKLRVFNAARRLVTLGRFDPQLPTLGGSFAMEMFSEPFTAVFALYSPFVGANGADLNLLPPVRPLGLYFTNSLGEATINFNIPNNPALVGIDVYFQWMSTPQNGDWGPGNVLSVPETLRVVP